MVEWGGKIAFSKKNLRYSPFDELLAKPSKAPVLGTIYIRSCVLGFRGGFQFSSYKKIPLISNLVRQNSLWRPPNNEIRKQAAIVIMGCGWAVLQKVVQCLYSTLLLFAAHVDVQVCFVISNRTLPLQLGHFSWLSLKVVVFSHQQIIRWMEPALMLMFFLNLHLSRISFPNSNNSRYLPSGQ